ncbi:MAG: hypothetical protein ACHQQQ_03770 [Bacteroidota bacterium]
MKHPLAVVIISKDPETQREIHTRFDAVTSFPRLKLLTIFIKALFKGKF